MTERDLHDMGGNIGPASDRAASAKDGDAADSAPHGGYAQDVDPSVVGEATQNSVTEGSDRGGSTAAPPVAGAHSEYVSIDDADNLGRGADGETAARVEQNAHGGPGAE